jgi:hypothetical protein
MWQLFHKTKNSDSGHGQPAAGCPRHLSSVRWRRLHHQARGVPQAATPPLASLARLHSTCERALARSVCLRKHASRPCTHESAATAHLAVAAPALAAASPVDSSGQQHRTALLTLAVMVASPAEQGCARIAILPALPLRAKLAGACRCRGQSCRLPLVHFFLLL